MRSTSTELSRLFVLQKGLQFLVRKVLDLCQEPVDFLGVGLRELYGRCHARNGELARVDKIQRQIHPKILAYSRKQLHGDQ